MSRARRTLLAAVAALVATAALGPPAPAGAAVRTPQELLGWIAEHPRSAGLAVVRPGDGRVLVAASARRRFPLASTRKVVVLGAYAEAVAAGRLDPAERVALADLERWYWPGTDGGAHERAMAEARATGTLTGEGAAQTLPLDAIARAMIRWSDNAASDLLLARLGPAADAFARRHRVGRDPLMPLLGEFVAWTQVRPERWRALGPVRRARLAWRLAERTTPADLVGFALPPVPVLERLVRRSVTGRPLAWARLLADLGTGRGLAPAAAAVVRRHLEWPLEAPPVAEAFTRFGSKGGVLPGVVTEATHLRPRGGAGLAVAVFLRDLPRDVQTDLAESFAQQALVVRLATDPAFLAAARERLGPGRGRAG